ncbi:MAG: ATP-binding cassette domain-containing protein [Candidatus Brocadiia bacterium]
MKKPGPSRIAQPGVSTVPWRSLLLSNLFVLAISFPFLTANPYYIHVATVFLLYVILSLGLSIMLGHAGLLAIGYVAFFAVGAYFYGVLNSRYGLPFLAAIPLGAMAAAATGAIIGLPTLRVRGDYLALVSLAFLQICQEILLNWVPVTGGAKGIPGIDGPRAFGLTAAMPMHYYWVVLGIALLVVAISTRIARSSLARVWEAIRDDEIAAKACGFNTTNWLLVAFMIGAAIAGVAGVLFASIQRFVTPESFGLGEAILVLAIVVLAGGRSLARVAVACAVLFGLPEVLRGFAEYRLLIFGVLLVVFTVVDDILRRRRSHGDAVPATDLLPQDLKRALPDSLRPLGPPATAILLENLSKRFRGVEALKPVDIRLLCERRIIGLVGTNGAGKTTLFNCLSGLVEPDSGRITVVGIGEISSLRADKRSRLGLGRTFQQVRLFNSLTVRQNVEIGALNGRAGLVLHELLLGRIKPIGEVDAALQFLSLNHLADVQVATLPIGLQRKVEIARALAHRPKLLLLDEVASGLNEAEKKELSYLLQQIAESGIPIVLVEHDVAFVSMVASYVVVLDAGKVIGEGLPAEVMSEPKVVTSYLGLEGGCHAGNA